MVQTFWRKNRIRNVKTAASGCSDSAPNVSSNGQKAGHTILHDYQNDIKRRFRYGNAPLEWKEWLESQKTMSKKTAVKSSIEESNTASLPNDAGSLHVSDMPRSSASSVSSLAWRREAFFLSPEDYQRYSSVVVLLLSHPVLALYYELNGLLCSLFCLSTTQVPYFMCRLLFSIIPSEFNLFLNCKRYQLKKPLGLAFETFGCLQSVDRFQF